MSEAYTVFADGSLEPRAPRKGFACCAFIVFAGTVCGREGSVRPAPVYKQHGCIGRYPQQTSQTAEYRAVLTALKWCAKHIATCEIELRTDSQLVERQISGEYGCHADHLRPYRDECRELLKGLPNCRVVWVRREENDVADELTRIATKQAMNGGKR